MNKPKRAFWRIRGHVASKKIEENFVIVERREVKGDFLEGRNVNCLNQKEC